MSIAQLLEAVKSGSISPAEAAKLIPSQGAAGKLRFKVSEKGALSVMGLQSKWPVTLYADQWERLFTEENLKEMKKFIAENNKTLKRKVTE